MSTFDGWEDQLYGDAIALPESTALAHFRTKGSKNGVRRYQMPDGTWTPLGLKERKAREGWGESRKERKANKALAKAEKKAAKTQRRVDKIEARKARVAAAKEKSRLKDVSKLTDDELRKRIARVKMEQEYKEMTRNPLLKNGEKLASMLIEGRNKRYEEQAAKAKLALENKRLDADIIKARESTKRAKEERRKARQERKKAKIEEGQKTFEARANLQKAKTDYRNTTLRGALGKFANIKLTAGYKESLAAIRKAKADARSNRIKSDEAHALAKHKSDVALKERNAGIKAYEKEQSKLRKKKTESTR